MKVREDDIHRSRQGWSTLKLFNLVALWATKPHNLAARGKILFAQNIIGTNKLLNKAISAKQEPF